MVDDHQIVLDGMRLLLEQSDAIEIVGEANRAGKALELVEVHLPDVVITDIQMPELNGIGFTRQLKAKFPQIKVLALSMEGKHDMISEMLDAGVDGYVLKSIGREELLKAIEMVMQGEMYFSSEVATEMMRTVQHTAQKQREEKIARLSPREKEILQLVLQEKSNKEIGETLFISERTVETHRKNIFRKTRTNTIVGLVKYAMENDLVD